MLIIPSTTAQWLKCILSFCLFIPCIVHGNESREQHLKDGLAVQIQPSAFPHYITDSVKVRGRVTSLWDSGCDVRKIFWVLPDAVDRTRSVAALSGNGGNAMIAGSKERMVIHSLTKGDSTDFELILPPSSFLNSQDSKWNLLGFSGGRYSIPIFIEYAESASSAKKVIERNIDIEFLPATSSLVIGGVIGSGLLVIFERLVRLLNALRMTTWPLHKSLVLDWREIFRRGILWTAKEGPSGLVQFLLGGITAAVVLLLIGAGQGSDLPVMLQMKGFGGAIVIGLFTHKLAEFVYKKLKVSKTSDDNTTEVKQPRVVP